MNTADLLLSAVPLFAGSFLLLKVSSGHRGHLRPRALADAYRTFHAPLFALALRGKLLSFPGARLVSSCRGWLAGEAVALAVLAAGIAAGPSVTATAKAAVLAILSGVAVAWLSFRDEARRHLQAVRAELPLAAFLMALLLEAGMGSQAALRETIRSLSAGPLSRDLDALARQRSMGVPPGDSLENARRRVPLEEYHAFLNLIHQGERLGVGLSKSLGELSARMLEAQEQRAEANAQKASVKVLLPLVLFIFPSVFLIILSPVILNISGWMGG